MSCCKLRTPWPIHFKLCIVIGIDSLMVCILFGEISIFHSYRGPAIDDTYQVLVHLAQRFQRRRLFRNQPIRNKNCLWRPCLLTDRDEMSNLLTTVVSCALRAAVYLNSSPLKPYCQMNRNLVGSIFGGSSVKIAHFVPIR
jgi:hypothetical protein